MNTRNLAYWIPTALFGLALTGSGIATFEDGVVLQKGGGSTRLWSGDEVSPQKMLGTCA